MKLLAAIAVLAVSTLAFAQAKEEPPQKDSIYAPETYQAGKDVVWVGTPQKTVDTMLDLARVTPQDFVIDLGSGDGRLVITAAKRGARALGIEYNPDLVALSKRNAERNGVAGKAEFVKADLFESDFSKATVITMFLLPDLNLKLRPKILALAPGTRIVSNTFTMGDWEADQIVKLSGQPGCTNAWCNALYWIVPAQVAGTWHIPQGTLVLEQKFQKLTGSLQGKKGKPLPVAGKVQGTEIAFTAGTRDYRAKMNAGKLELLP